MNKWYKSNWIKGVLSILVCLSMLTVAICGVSVLQGLSENLTWHDITNHKTQDYADSEAFANTLNNSAFEITSQISMATMFETDGVFDGNKLVDVEEFATTHNISNKNESGFAYTLQQLIDWYSHDSSEEPVYIVCKKQDGTYHYYQRDEFKKLVENDSLNFILSDDTDASEDFLLENLYNGYYTSDYGDKFGLLDSNNQMIYSDCWALNSSVSENYAPEGAESIIDIANDNPQWNGKLSDMIHYLDTTISSLVTDYADYQYPSADYTEGNTNLSYLLLDKDHHIAYTNNSDYADYEKAAQNVEAMKKLGAYAVITPELKGFESNLATTAVSWQYHQLILGGQAPLTDYTLVIAMDTTFPIQDSFYTNNQEYETFMPYILPLLICGIIALFLCLIAIVWLTIIAGRNSKNDGITLHPFDRIWTELAAILVMGGWFFAIYGIISTWDSNYRPYYNNMTRIGADTIIVASTTALITAVLFLVGWLSLIRRIKARTLWRDSLLRKFCHLCVYVLRATGRFIHDFWGNRSQSVKITVVMIVLILLHLFSGITGYYAVFPVLIVLVVDIVTAVLLIRHAILQNQIKKGLREISMGNVEYRIDTSRMKGDTLQIATLVNNIGNGLHEALAQSMKDERMKTDLITNVSHDIKTPLTSIINYIDLLKRENLSDPTILGYIDVLEQKAQRLKTLTEDVVEASKVSSGNITLEMMNINLVEMLNQIEGEFIEKFESRNLSVVMSKPEEPVIIYADGRRLSRILENIYGNAYKYAMEGTRIYADLSFVDGKAAFSLKNISEQALNISADELTERFIRGDISRTTEGSGLGLSIAKSLTELQGGTFHLYLDGDLFKVTITFPIGE